MSSKDKIIIVKKLIHLLSNDKLNETQKMKLLKAIKSMQIATEIQKDRFILFYGLDKDRQKYKEIAQKYDCSYTAVRSSILETKNKLSRVENLMDTIKEIVDECEGKKD